MRLLMPRKRATNTFRFQPALDKTSTKCSKKRLIRPYLLWKIEERLCSDKELCFHINTIELLVNES